MRCANNDILCPGALSGEKNHPTSNFDLASSFSVLINEKLDKISYKSKLNLWIYTLRYSPYVVQFSVKFCSYYTSNYVYFYFEDQF